MDKLGNNSWKKFYQAERESRREELVRKLEEVWKENDDEVASFIRDGGMLSFPHTFLDQSMEPLLRTVKAIYSSGKRKVVAIGVLHLSNSEDGIPDEFCLDGFKYILDPASETFGLPGIEVREFYVSRKEDQDPDDLQGLADHLVDQGIRIGSNLGPDTAMVITGDLSHYGHGYGMKDVSLDPASLIKGHWERSLDLLYRKKDLVSYLQHARMSLNDQLYMGVAASAALGDGLDFKVFSYTLADYSEVLESKSPTVVASVFYGVKRASMNNV